MILLALAITILTSIFIHKFNNIGDEFNSSGPSGWIIAVAVYVSSSCQEEM